jgi:hypothetical protein
MKPKVSAAIKFRYLYRVGKKQCLILSFPGGASARYPLAEKDAIQSIRDLYQLPRSIEKALKKLDKALKKSY